MVFQGSRLFFHGVRSVFMVFMVPGWFFMVPGRFSWFFVVPGWFFIFHIENTLFGAYHKIITKSQRTFINH